MKSYSVQKAPTQYSALIVAVVFSYLWIAIPSLNLYALQATATLVLMYSLKKLFQKKRQVHRASTMSYVSQTNRKQEFFPSSKKQSQASLRAELFMLVSALLLLIGHTGGISSIFLPGLYVLLFIAVFALQPLSLVLLGMLIPTFLWAILPHTPSLHEISTLISFPLLIPLMLFAKLQYQEAQEDEKEIRVLSDQENNMLLFLSTYLKPKLLQIQQLAMYIDDNKTNIQKQIALLLEETKNLTSDAPDFPQTVNDNTTSEKESEKQLEGTHAEQQQSNQ